MFTCPVGSACDIVACVQTSEESLDYYFVEFGTQHTISFTIDCIYSMVYKINFGKLELSLQAVLFHKLENYSKQKSLSNFLLE